MYGTNNVNGLVKCVTEAYIAIITLHSHNNIALSFTTILYLPSNFNLHFPDMLVVFSSSNSIKLPFKLNHRLKLLPQFVRIECDPVLLEINHIFLFSFRMLWTSDQFSQSPIYKYLLYENFATCTCGMSHF